MNARDLKVLISDDHELIREGLKRILVDGGMVSRVGEVTVRGVGESLRMRMFGRHSRAVRISNVRYRLDGAHRRALGDSRKV